MKKYEILEHRADLKIRVFGKTKKELFKNALLGMTNSLLGEIKSEKLNPRFIKIKALDLNSLLVDFLNEVLYLIQINKEIYQKIKFKKFSDTEIQAELLGQKIKRFNLEIKAATYHNLNITQLKNGLWQTTILFDI